MQVISANDNGGGGHHVLNLFNTTIDNFQNYLCLLGEGPLIEKARMRNISYDKFENTIKNTALAAYINKGGFDIVNFHGAKAVFAYMMIKHNLCCSTVVTVHSDFNYDFTNNKLKYFLYTPIYKNGLRMFNNYICLSTYILNLLQKEKMEGKKYIISNGIDLDKIHISRKKEDVRRSLGILPDDFMFVVVARFHPVKNHINLLPAFKSINEEFKNVYLTLLGSGELEEHIRNEAAALGINEKVIFLGYQENAIDYINASDINMIISLNEGGVPPLSILEGFAVQKPAIISEFQGVRNILNKDCTFFVEPQSVDSIYTAMKKAYLNRDRLRDMGNEGLEILKEKFAISHFCKSYYNIYMEILQNAKDKE